MRVTTGLFKKSAPSLTNNGDEMKPDFSKKISIEMEARLRELHYSIPYRSNNRNRKLKLLFLEKYRVCFWCGVNVRVIEHARNTSRLAQDMATIDHVESKYFRKKGQVVTKVLACYSCNKKRADIENRIYGKKPIGKVK